MAASKKNGNLHKARAVKNDEFYTRLTDIEKELVHYREHFRGKTVFCNCDDPAESNFWLYFSLNFEFLGLKKLVSTHYDATRPTYKLERTGPTDADVIRTPLKQNGDFRSDECIALLQEADIVVTNPPFSLFREYVAQLMAYDKEFLIIGNMNAITYKEIFPLIKDNKMWLGMSPRSMTFLTPSGDSVQVNAVWFTNLSHKKRNQPLDLYRRYKGNEDKYPKYDNYDAIEVSKVADIPYDYEGVMGVPVTFLEKYNPNQFEILGIANSARWIGYECLTLINSKKIYNRLLVKLKLQ